MTDLLNKTTEQIAKQIKELNEWLDAREYAEYYATHVQGEDFDPNDPWQTFPPEERTVENDD